MRRYQCIGGVKDGEWLDVPDAFTLPDATTPAGPHQPSDVSTYILLKVYDADADEYKRVLMLDSPLGTVSTSHAELAWNFDRHCIQVSTP